MPDDAGSSRPQPRLRALAIRGSAWTIVAHGARQVLRLGGNLVLTRLLSPQAFGLIALVQVVIRGIAMFSDTGVNTSVVRSKRGDEPTYLNTAWTIGVFRGGLLWLVASALAWPAAQLYDQPQLLAMIPVGALGAVIMGLASVKVFTLQRHVNLRPLIILQFTTALVGLIVTIALAYWFRSVWALILGGLVQRTLYTIFSYIALDAPPPKFEWDRPAAREMYKFGRWIFLSTAITFLLQQGDRAILGTMITAEQLGVYSIAVMLSRAPLEALFRLNGNVLLPIYARVLNEQPETIRPKLYRARSRLLALFLPVLWVLILFGQPLVNLLYDSRYREAGLILQWLAAGTAASVISVTSGIVLLSAGDSFKHMVVQIWRGTALILGIALGYHFGGLHGLVAGIALSRFTDYIPVAWAVRPLGVWMPRLDALAYAATGIVMLIGLST